MGEVILKFGVNFQPTFCCEAPNMAQRGQQFKASINKRSDLCEVVLRLASEETHSLRCINKLRSRRYLDTYDKVVSERS